MNLHLKEDNNPKMFQNPRIRNMTKILDIRNIIVEIENRIGKGNRGDMRIIHVTRQFFEASGPQGHFFEKTKKLRF